ncbi:3-ketoacyl-ACP reductase [Achromatium sp. WMS2]|nr:3-ketoacyl-ACP reductase [Achromatium sp. WMS2]
MANELTSRIALVTGASRGIGRAITTALAQAGATVIGTATTPAGAASITEYLQSQGLNGQGKVLNVADPSSVTTLMQDIETQFGPPTILVNNAAITKDNLLMRMKDEEWTIIMDTNLTSVYRLSKACLRGMMKARFGRIINIGSVVGSSGNAGQTNYATAKAGLLGFSRSLAREIGSRGITVNTVAPGCIDTDMTKELGPEMLKAILATIPLGRIGQPEDIAHTVVFLASPGGNYITGETIHVNGGMYMD